MCLTSLMLKSKYISHTVRYITSKQWYTPKQHCGLQDSVSKSLYFLLHAVHKLLSSFEMLLLPKVLQNSSMNSSASLSVDTSTPLFVPETAVSICCSLIADWLSDGFIVIVILSVFFIRHYKAVPNLPERLQPECMVRLYGLRACVIRALHYTYPPFVNKLKAVTTFEGDPHNLTKRQCVLMWHKVCQDSFQL